MTHGVVDVLCTGRGTFQEFRHARQPGAFHGTGCALSALITGYMAKGEPLQRAVARGERVLQTMMSS
ncbi:MAG: hypothetical protein GWN18_00005, partial [Thermoplasmata archaeon]|nr:hypothetical protein [Thermoplasmata archaeon]NIS10348.1 hypothetical protein [Thermoplasmata archaeon]NIS18342.1 hypothetical protein [Thermoplasmata archaeon]NIT75315.1 hypothetical protein [Thermoplasmata archaeon]NIU47496.1 hypothetical protein [Thermoplasmata archaeon]